MDITSADLVTSLAGTTCPACARIKRPRMTLCSGCFYELPPAARNALYDKLGSGYREAVLAAMARLGATKFNMPVKP